MKKNTVVKLLGNEKVGFHLGMMAYAEFEEEAEITVEEFFKSAQSGNVRKKHMATFFKAAANSYNYRNKVEKDIDVRDVYFWIDELLEQGAMEETLSQLLASPAPKEDVKESKSGK